MGELRASRLNLLLMFIGAAALIITLGLTYLRDTLYGLRGSTLAYLGWLMLSASAVFALLAMLRPGSRSVAVSRTITLAIGLVVISLTVVLFVVIERMMQWW